MFLLFVAVGILAGVVTNLLPGEHHVRWSAYFIGLGGAWIGGYATAAFVQGTFITMGWITLAGAVVGAVLHIAVFEAVARSVVRHELL